MGINMKTNPEICNQGEEYLKNLQAGYCRDLSISESYLEIKSAWINGYREAIKDLSLHIKDIFKDHNY